MKKKVDIMSYSSLNLIQGANKVIQTQSTFSKYFHDFEINKVYSLNSVIDVKNGEKVVVGATVGTAKHSIIKQIRTALRVIFDSRITLFCMLKAYLNWIRAAKQVANSYVISDNSDVILFEEMMTAYFLFKKYPELPCKTALVIHTEDDSLSQIFHTFPSFTKKQKEKLFEIRNYVYQRVDKVIYLSNKASKGSVAPDGKATYIYNGIADYHYDLTCKGDKINFVCVGSMDGRKGQQFVIEALHMIGNEYLSKLHLHLIGDGKIRGQLEEMVEKYELKDCVTFYGVRKDVADLLEQMDVYIMPSVSEGLSISTVEGLRAGLYQLLTDVGGNSEVAGNECGMMITTEPDNIARAIKSVIDNGIVDLNRKKACRKHYESNFTIEIMAQKYEQVFKEIVE